MYDIYYANEKLFKVSEPNNTVHLYKKAINEITTSNPGTQVLTIL